jgi:hypothetical protein
MMISRSSAPLDVEWKVEGSILPAQMASSFREAVSAWQWFTECSKQEEQAGAMGTAASAEKGSLLSSELRGDWVPDAHTECFLSHCWGRDELGRDNHARVRIIKDALQKRGLQTWFDEDKLRGNIAQTMMSGMDNAECVVVFLTQRYMEKATGSDERDNVHTEFNYAVQTKGSERMIAVVMEEGMRSAGMWSGEVGNVLAGQRYVDMYGDLNNTEYLAEVADMLQRTILRLISIPVEQLGRVLDPAIPAAALRNSK